MSLTSLIRAAHRQDLIITPKLDIWLMQHGDDAFPPHVVDRVAELMGEQPRDRRRSFSGSAAGTCPRRQELAFAGVPVSGPDPQLQGIFTDGKFRHLRWQAWLLTMGLLTDVEYTVLWPDKYHRGTLDGRGEVPLDHPNPDWHGLEFGFELKGVSTFQYSKFAQSGPMEKHLQQVDDYFVLTGMDLFVIVYEDKTTQAYTEWVIEPDPNRMAVAEARIEELNQAVRTKTLHAQRDDCAIKAGSHYTECPYGRSGHCHRAIVEPPKPFVRSA